MTKYFVLFAVTLVLAGSPAAAAEVDLFPQDTTWTGGIYYIPSWPYWGYWWQNPITWGNFFWMTTPCNERGFARYDLTPVPDGATVTGATVHYFVYYDTLATETEIRLFDVVPVPDSDDQAQFVYDSIGAGTLVAERESTFLGWNAVPLNSAAHRAIEQRLVTSDWLGLGWLYPGTDSADAVARGWRSDTLKTRLTVVYELTAVSGEARTRSPAGFVIEENPVRGRLLRVRSGAAGILSVFDAAGRQVLAASVPDGRSLVDLRRLGPGVYLARLDSGRAASVGKLVIE